MAQLFCSEKAFNHVQNRTNIILNHIFPQNRPLHSVTKGTISPNPCNESTKNTEKQVNVLSIYVDHWEAHVSFVTYEFLTNIAQESNSILVSDHLFKQFIGHKNNFLLSTNKECIRLRQNIDTINDNIKNGVPFESINEKYQAALREFINNSNDDKVYDWRIVREIYAYCTSCNLQRWEIRKYGKYYLLIPKSYLTRLGCKAALTELTNEPISECEYKLGLKIDHLPQIDQHHLDIVSNYIRDDAASTYDKKLYKDLVDIDHLQKLFVTKKEYAYCEKEITTRPHWNLLIVGHGGHASPQKLDLIKKINSLTTSFSAEDLKNLAYTLTNKSLTYSTIDNQAINTSAGTEEINPFANTETITIGNVPLDDWSTFLQFCEKQLCMNLVLIHGCHAGGFNFEKLLRTQDGKKYVSFSFPIAASTIFDAFVRSSNASAHIPLKLQQTNVNQTTQCIQFGTKDSTLHAVLNNIHSTHLEDISKTFEPYLQSWKIQENCENEINNIFPGIKYPHSDTIYICKPCKNHLTIGDVRAKTHYDKPIIIPQNVQSVALTTNHIDVLKINHTETDDLNIVSHIPGNTTHTINTLIAPNMKCNFLLHQLFACFTKLQNNKSHKTFIIKKLCLEGQEYHNVRIENYHSDDKEYGMWTTVHNWHCGRHTIPQITATPQKHSPNHDIVPHGDELLFIPSKL